MHETNDVRFAGHRTATDGQPAATLLPFQQGDIDPPPGDGDALPDATPVDRFFGKLADLVARADGLWDRADMAARRDSDDAHPDATGDTQPTLSNFGISDAWRLWTGPDQFEGLNARSLTLEADQIATTSGNVLHVADAEALHAALAGAKGGETIVLADGDYGELMISASFETTVTLMAATQHGARVTAFGVSDSSNLTFDGLLFDYVYVDGHGDGKKSFEIVGSSFVTVRNSLFDGDNMDNPDDPGHGYAISRGLRVNKTSDVLIENNEFRTFWKAMNLGTNTDLVVRGNDIHDIRSDGINITRSDGVLIEGNHIHDFRGNAATGDHADMIQMYSTTDGILPRNITIRDNILDIGGGTSEQAILINHNKATRDLYGDDLAFENVVVTGNVIRGGSIHGITIEQTNGVEVSGNTVFSPYGSGLNKPRIRVEDSSTGVVIRDNIAEGLSTPAILPDGWLVDGNLVIQQESATAPNAYEDVFLSPRSASLDGYLLRLDSQAALDGLGAAALHHDTSPEALTALAYADRTDLRNEIRFDGSLSAGPGGPLDQTGATFAWDFGDGTTATGIAPVHRYTAPGIYDVILTVLTEGGETDTFVTSVAIKGPDLLGFEADRGLLVVSGAEGDVFVDPAEHDTTQRAEDGPQTLDFVPETKILVPDAVRAGLEGAESLRLSLGLTAENAGAILGVKHFLTLLIGGDGALTVHLGEDKIVFDQAGLLDAAPHDLVFDFNGPKRTLTLTVDGESWSAPLSTAALPAEISNHFKLGSVKGSDGGFTGNITALDLDVNHIHYDMMPAPTALSSPMPEPTVSIPESTGRLEIGNLEVTQEKALQWHAVTFEDEIPNARVVMGPVSAEGQQPAFARVRNVTETGFEFQIDEWDYHNGRHVTEAVGWIAVSDGSHSLPSGARISSGQVAVADFDATGVALTGFSEARGPVTALAQVTGAAGKDAVIARVTDVTVDGFSVAMREQESKPPKHVTETIDWVAIEAGSAIFDFAALQLDHTAQMVDLTGSVLLAQIQTAIEADPAVLRHDRTAEDQLSLWLQEETSADAEVDHTIEEVHALTTEAGGYLLTA